MISSLQKHINNSKLLAILIIIICLSVFTNKKIIEEKKSIESLEQTYIEDNKLTLFAVGDALIHDAVYKDAKTNEIGDDGYDIYNFKSMLSEIKPLASSHDLSFYNQETIIGGKNLGLSNYPEFNSPDEIGLDMLDSGFNIVNLATNHTLDKGITGATYSINFWEKQNAYITGSYSSKENRDNIKIAEKNGITYAVISYTYGANGKTVPQESDYLINIWSEYNKNAYEEYKKVVQKDIESIRDKVDLLIVSMHWGTEYTHEPNFYQKDAAEFLSSLGVDIIIGTHPHVIQPVEYVGNTLVIYSLGNFISAQDGIPRRIGMMVSLDINKHIENDTKTISISNIKTDLTWTYHERYRNFKVIPFYSLTDEQLKNHNEIYEEYKKIINPTEDERIQIGF